MAKQIQSITDLIPDAANANKGTERGRYAVEASLRETGAGRSIVVDKDGRIIAGNKTLEAWADISGEIEIVKTDGKKLIVVQREDLDLSDVEGLARKLAYYDNRAGQLGLEWDAEQLFSDLNAGVDLSSMFFDDEIADILATINGYEKETAGEDPGADVSKADELQAKWNVQLGDLWQLGDHRLICGDCTDEATVSRVMGGEKADCTVTDPPYGVGVEYGSFDDTLENVQMLVGKFMPTLPLPAALTPGIPAMWCYPKPAWVGAWVHPASTSSGPWGFIGANPILYYGKDPYLSEGKGRRDCSLVSVADRKGEDDHPVAKPLNVWLWLVERMTPNAGAIVYEPFSGSGTTIIACEQLGRKCRAVELHPPYVSVALERFFTMTGVKPVLLERI